MSRRLLLLPALLATVCAGVLAAPIAGAAHHRQRHVFVTVGDDYFAPSHLTRHRAVRVGTKVTWRWAAANTNVHNVKLTRGPRHVRHFRSGTAAAGYRFSRVMRKRGLYRYVCTIHANVMRGVIRVKR